MLRSKDATSRRRDPTLGTPVLARASLHVLSGAHRRDGRTRRTVRSGRRAAAPIAHPRSHAAKAAGDRGATPPPDVCRIRLPAPASGQGRCAISSSTHKVPFRRRCAMALAVADRADSTLRKRRPRSDPGSPGARCAGSRPTRSPRYGIEPLVAGLDEPSVVHPLQVALQRRPPDRRRCSGSARVRVRLSGRESVCRREGDDRVRRRSVNMQVLSHRIQHEQSAHVRQKEDEFGGNESRLTGPFFHSGLQTARAALTVGVDQGPPSLARGARVRSPGSPQLLQTCPRPPRPRRASPGSPTRLRTGTRTDQADDARS